MSLTPEQARLLLRAARPDGRDDADPVFAEALALAKSDPELGRWLAGERQADLRLSRALDPVEAPADLKALILDRAKARETGRIPHPAQVVSKTFPFPRWALAPRSLTYALLALAALVVAALTILPPLLHPSYASYEGDLAEQIACGEVTRLDHLDASHATLEQWLAAHRAPSRIAIPAGLKPVPGLGCRTFEWQGRPIAQVCFAMRDGKIVHLFVVENAGWRKNTAPPQGRPQFNRHGDWTLASWREGTTTYVMAGEGDPDYMKKLL